MSVKLIPRRELGAEDADAMLALLARQFEVVSRQQFLRDLEEKNWVLLLGGDGGPLRGFSTLLLYETRRDGQPVSVVCSGDTVVDPASWSFSELSRAWIGAVTYLQRRNGLESQPLYWLLLTSGFRTYRFLPLYWRRFYPRWDEPIPPPVERWMQALAAERWGTCWHPDEGVVRFPQPQVLRPELKGIPPGRLADPHIAFFAAANPGHERGDELLCLVELNRTNLTPAGWRMWRAGERLFRTAEMPT